MGSCRGSVQPRNFENRQWLGLGRVLRRLPGKRPFLTRQNTRRQGCGGDLCGGGCGVGQEPDGRQQADGYGAQHGLLESGRRSHVSRYLTLAVPGYLAPGTPWPLPLRALLQPRMGANSMDIINTSGPPIWSRRVPRRARRTSKTSRYPSPPPALEQYLVCRVCGQECQNINWKHLDQHGLTGDQYKKKFKEDFLASPLLRWRYMASGRRRPSNHQILPRSREEMLRDLRRYAKGEYRHPQIAPGQSRTGGGAGHRCQGA